MHEPLTEPDDDSGPLYVADEQLPIPETPSLPEKEMVTGLVYHPFESAPRDGAPVTPVGGSLSIFAAPAGVLTLDDPPALVAEQLRV